MTDLATIARCLATFARHPVSFVRFHGEDFPAPARVSQTFGAFRSAIYSRCPERSQGHVVDLRERIGSLLTPRKLCGQHGRIIPSRQDLCPHCGGRCMQITESPRSDVLSTVRV